jgi:hypothetical protein
VFPVFVATFGAAQEHIFNINLTGLREIFQITAGSALCPAELYTFASNVLPSMTLQRKIEN